MNQHTENISAKRLFWFKLITISFPFIVIALIELTLRLFNYGANYQLFIPDGDNDEYRVMNPVISEKYFTQKENSTIGYFEKFKIQKEPGTIRMFVLGASTAVGFPYFHNGSFHRMLQWKLQQIYPGFNIEIINTSLTAVNSYTIQDFARELVEYEPDAVLIYAGHNEYYGALGVGASSQMGSWPALVRLTIRLKEFKIVQLLFNLHQKIFQGKEKAINLKENLMKRMVKSHEIPHGSEVFYAGLNQFESNLDKTLAVLVEHDIPVIVGDLISNESDQPPLHASLRKGLDSVSFYSGLQKARTYLDDQPEQALTIIDSLISLDSCQAEAYFWGGKASFFLGDSAKALSYFQNARKHDLLRFRAPDEINDIIFQLSEKYGVTLAEVGKKFRQASSGGIIGSKLVLEHLHPNLSGYRLMADAYLEAIQKTNVFPRHINPKEPLVAWHEYPITAVDTLFGYYGTLILKEGWPFFEPFEMDTSNRSIPEAIAGALVVKQISWEQAMEQLYQYYYKRNAYNEALRVAKSVILEYPENPLFYTKAGSLCLRLGEFEAGAAYFMEAYRLQQEPQFAYYAALCFAKRKEWARSTEMLDLLLEKAPDHKKAIIMLKTIREIEYLHRQEQTSNHEQLLQLARNYYLLGLKKEAHHYIKSMLEINPNDQNALQLLEKLSDI